MNAREQPQLRRHTFTADTTRGRPLCKPAVSRCSEIRFVRPGHVGVLSRVPLDVFRASLFLPFIGANSISHGCGPRRREDAFILHRKPELQVLALWVRAKNAALRAENA